MKRILLICLNIGIVIPGIIGLDFISFIWPLVFIVSILSVIFSNTKTEFIIYSMILYICSVSGVCFKWFYIRFIDEFQVGYHPEVDIMYQQYVLLHTGYMVFVVCFSCVIKHFLLKKK